MVGLGLGCAGWVLEGRFRKGSDILLLAGVGGPLLSPAPIVGLPACCVDSLEGTLDPPLPPRFMGCPPTIEDAADPGAGDGVADCRFPTLRSCART